MQKDPDNIDNLIDNPEHRAVAVRMSASLRSWQEQVYDAGLLPESEMVKCAANHQTTIYEMVRNPKLYNLSALLDAADLALKQKPENLPRLHDLLKSPDSGLRYWGIVGCFLLNDGQIAPHYLNDESHEVRAMAAWLLVKVGEKEKGFQCLGDLLRERSCATLKVLNIIDWMGDEGKALMPVVQSQALSDYEEGMQKNLLTKFAMADTPKK
jgi:hypothetical protein